MAKEAPTKSRTVGKSAALERWRSGVPKEGSARAHAMLEAEATAHRDHRYRAGKKGLLVYVDPEVHRAVGRIHVETGRTRQDLLEEAVDLLLHKYRRFTGAGS